MKNNLSECKQDKCTFLLMGVGCRECDTCKASPYILDDSCDRCWNCSRDIGVLRWNDETDNDNIEDKLKNKKLIPEMKIK